tara:strand:+ start:132 stop:1655 length:1524 start_codon:yes stop_codon:yes gene_type:complete
MMAASMVPLAGMVGGGLDMSRAYMARAKLQNACDAASLASRQGMTGRNFTSADEATAQRFFDFNFPAGTMDARNVTFSVAAHPTDVAALQASASADIPTSLMKIFGKTNIAISVDCNTKRDIGNNDVMLVLDVTGSMLCAPGTTGTCSEGPSSKIRRLRAGTEGLYRALDDGSSGQTRYGIMPYSGTVNVARQLTNNQVVTSMQYPDCNRYGGVSTPSGYYYGCNRATYRTVHIDNSRWASSGSSSSARLAAWRASGQGCIEERASISSSSYLPQIQTAVERDDIDRMSGGSWDINRQWGRYDYEEWTSFVKSGYRIRWAPAAINDAPYWQVACPSEAKKLAVYGTESGFRAAVDSATAKVSGGTYHDIGIIWGMRFLSSTGMFAATNPTSIDDYPVNKHIIFMTDGRTDTQTNPWFYSAYGVNAVENRVQGTGNSDERHVARFQSACALARSMGITIWVIALDVADTSDIKPCATSAGQFYTSDGTDLESIFTQIGQGIGDLRLTS